MPEALTKKMFGLPRWAWLTILAVAIGIGLYLRYRQSKEDEEVEQASESPTGLVGTEAVPVGGYNEVGEGGGYYYGGGGQGGYEGFGYEGQENNPAEININVGEPTLPSATDGEAHTVQSGQTPCSKKPSVPDGFHAECVSGHWKVVANTHRKRGDQHVKPGTGGGPPNRVNNKGPKRNSPIVVGVSGGGGQGPGSEGHPNAVDTGNACVKGGVGGHTAPPGYHLYCGGNGHIWRAPNN